MLNAICCISWNDRSSTGTSASTVRRTLIAWLFCLAAIKSFMPATNFLFFALVIVVILIMQNLVKCISNISYFYITSNCTLGRIWSILITSPNIYALIQLFVRLFIKCYPATCIHPFLRHVAIQRCLLIYQSILLRVSIVIIQHSRRSLMSWMSIIMYRIICGFRIPSISDFHISDRLSPLNGLQRRNSTLSRRYLFIISLDTSRLI